MVAVIDGFDTRSDVGLRPPTSVSRNIDPVGSTLHWFGPTLSIRSHADCRAYLRQAQRLHMSPGGLGTVNGAADLAYNIAACIHRRALAGRGAGIRSGANGTSAANSSRYAILAIIGSRNTVTEPLLDAIDWCVDHLRSGGGAGRLVDAHSDHRPTACPGPDLRSHARARNGRPIPQPTTEATSRTVELWLATWPSWARPMAADLYARGIVTLHTDPRRTLAVLPLGQALAFSRRYGAADVSSPSTDLDKPVGEVTLAEAFAFVERR